MPEISPLCGRVMVTRRDSGRKKGTESFIGREEIPLSLGRMEPSATKATRFPERAAFGYRSDLPGKKIASSNSLWFVFFCREKAFCTQTGRKSKRIFSSSVALIVLPFAGKPIKKRAMISFSVISQAVRLRTSCPQ